MKPLLAIFVGFFFFSEVSAQEKCTIDIRSRVGDKLVYTEKFSMEGSFVVTISGLKQDMEMINTRHGIYTDHVLSVDEDGWRDKVFRSVKKSVETAKMPGETEVKTSNSSLEGESFIIIHQEESPRFESIPEGVKESDLTDNMHLACPIFVTYLPRGVVFVGNRWEIPEKDLLTDWNNQGGDGLLMSSGSAVGSWKSIEGDIAAAVYDVQMKGKTSDDADATASLTVTVLVDHKSGRLLSINGKGKMTVSGEIEQEGQSMLMEGDFSLNIVETYSYR